MFPTLGVFCATTRLSMQWLVHVTVEVLWDNDLHTSQHKDKERGIINTWFPLLLRDWHVRFWHSGMGTGQRREGEKESTWQTCVIWQGKNPTLKLISAVAADSWQPDKKSLKARKHDMWRKQAVDRGRVWLRLLIKDHPPSFCLFFSLLTSLKASWTSGQQRSSFF